MPTFSIQTEEYDVLHHFWVEKLIKTRIFPKLFGLLQSSHTEPSFPVKFIFTPLYL